MSIQLDKWDNRFLGLARSISTWSKDPSTRIGAVIVDKQKRIVSTGYNGFPQGMEDDPELLRDRAQKYARIIHAEMNAILFAGHQARGSTLYMWGMAGPPCTNCTKHIIQAGIERVIAEGPPVKERWAVDLELSEQMLREAGVEFKAFHHPFPPR